MPIGRPFQPGNKFGRGRPLGSRNKKSSLARELLDNHSEAVMRQALVLALKGDPHMIRILLPHILRTDVPLNTGPLPMRSAAELSQASEKLIQKVTSGKISVSDALGIANLMEHRRHILETKDHEERLRAIEQSADEKKGE